jgi:hypothetical protein
MGHRGIGVAFADTDVADAEATGAAWPGAASPSAYAVMSDSLGALVDDVVQADFVVGLAMARRAEAIERAREWSEVTARAQAADASGGGSLRSRLEMAERGFTSEIGAALRIPDRTALTLIWTSRTLIHNLPSTLTALAEGRFSYRHAQVIVDQSYSLEPDAVARLEAAVLPAAERMTPSQFERTVRKTRERLQPESMVERQVKAEADRAVFTLPERDGMITLSACLPAVQAVAIDARLTEIARRLQTADEPRTLTQLRADVFSDILLDNICADKICADNDFVDTDAGDAPLVGRGDGPVARYRSIRPKVLVTIPMLTLLNRDSDSDRGGEPSSLEGNGPIDLATARELAANAPTLQRPLTDPVTAAVLAIGRKRYRIPEEIRTWLRVRDGTCRFPGCSRSAARSDIDHTDDWAHGYHPDRRPDSGPDSGNDSGCGTDHWNLAHLCPAHHALKHATGWRVEQTGDGAGILHWTSPTGIRYTTTPETAVTPAAK